MANVSGAQSISTSEIITTFSVDKPEIKNVLYRALGKQGANWFPLLDTLGMTEAVAQDIQQFFEEDYIHQTVHVGAGGILSYNAGTGVMTFLLDTTNGSNDFLAGSSTTPYPGTPIYYNPVKQYDILAFPSGSDPILFSVTSISGTYPTVTIHCTQIDLTQTFTSGNYPQSTEISIITNAFPEGTDQPVGQVNKPLIDYNRVQIVKSNAIWTGTQATNQAWVTQYSDDSGAILGYYVVGSKNAEYELGLAMDTALLFGRVTTTSIIDATSNEPVKSTEGHITRARRKGNVINYTSGAFSMGLFDTADAILEKQWASEYMFQGSGITLDNEKDNVLKSYFQFTDVNYVQPQAEASLFGFAQSMGSSMEGARAIVNFRYLQKGLRTYCFTRMPQFSNPKTMGITGMTTPALGLIAPIGTKPDAKDPSNRLPYFGMIYKQLGGYSRKTEVWQLSGAAPGQKVLSTDLNKLCFRSHIGASAVGSNTNILFDPA